MNGSGQPTDDVASEGKPPGKGARRRKASSTDDLKRTLAERDRQLRDVTEQALDLLDRLAEARQHEQERNAAVRRAEELTRQLDDARRRLRTAGGAVLRAAAATSETVPLTVVVWGGSADDVRLTLESLPASTPACWVGPPDALPPWAGEDDRAEWLTNAEARTPAQCWNLAMATTAAHTLFFVRAGGRLCTDVEIPPGATDASVALLQPVCRAEGRAWLGFEDDGGTAAARPGPLPTGDGPSVVARPDPGAFCVRRPAFEVVGMFDEALLGELALADFAARAQAHGLRVLSAPACTVDVRPGSDPNAPRDRLLLLASHRPAELGTALGETAVLWTLGAQPARALVLDLFGRLPESVRTGDALGSLLGAMVAAAAPASQIIEALHELLDTQVAVWTRPPLDAARADLDALSARTATTPTSVRAAVDLLREVLAFERRWLPLLADAHLSALGERDAAQQAAAACAREAATLQEGLQVVAQAIGMVAQEGPAQIRERLLVLRRDAEHLAELLAAAGAPSPTALIQELHNIRSMVADAREALHHYQEESTLQRRDLDLCRREAEERDRVLTDRERQLALLERMRSELADDATRRQAEIADLRRQLTERDRWIAGLLAEVQRRRLRPRKLLPHEVEFLGRQGRTP